MENQSNQTTKKGLILLIGVVIGLLTGILATAIVLSKTGAKSPTEVRVIAPEIPTGKDTVVKYVIHQYPNDPGLRADANAQADSLLTDSLYVEGNAMDYMLDEDVEPEPVDFPEASVTSEKMISRQEAPVLYFDAGKNATEAPEHATKMVEVQFWSTPIRNKVVYKFENNLLKIKGIELSEPKLIHYKNHYYLQSEKHIYQIQPTSEYTRLTEIHDLSFDKH